MWKSFETLRRLNKIVSKVNFLFPRVPDNSQQYDNTQTTEKFKIITSNSSTQECVKL